MKRLLLFALLSGSFYCQAQTSFNKQYDVAGVYRYAIGDYLTRNPSVIVSSKDGKEKLAFVKKHTYSSSFGDTISGIRLVVVDPAMYNDSISIYLKKKIKVTLLDVQQPILRDAKGQVWVMPVSTVLNPKNKTIGEAAYSGTGCNYTFNYFVMAKEYYEYKSTDCKTFE